MKNNTLMFCLLTACASQYISQIADAEPRDIPSATSGSNIFSAPPPDYSGKAATAEDQAISDEKFRQALAYAYENNPKLNAEREELKVLDEKVSQANAGFRPNLSADGAVGRERVRAEGEDWINGDDKNGEIVAIQPVFNGFGTEAQFKAARERVRAERAHLLATEQNVLLSAISSWLELCEKQRTLDLNLENLHRMYTYMQSAKKRFDSGDGTRTDLALTESRLADAEARYAIAEASRDMALASYERNLKTPAEIVNFPSLPTDLPRNENNVTDMVKGNPNLAEAEFMKNATTYDIDTASSSIWPSVYIRGSMSQDNSPPLGLDRLRDDSITLNVSIPLYQGGAEYSRVREANVEHEKSRLDAIDVERDVTERARDEWANYSSAKIVISASEKSAEASQRMVSGIETEQEQGTRTMTEVLDARNELFNAQVAQVQADKTLHMESYRLMASVGKLTAQELQLPVTQYDPKQHYKAVEDKWAGVLKNDQYMPKP